MSAQVYASAQESILAAKALARPHQQQRQQHHLEAAPLPYLTFTALLCAHHPSNASATAQLAVPLCMRLAGSSV